MKLISLNIEQHKHFDTIFSFFEQEKPDVICLQEVPEEQFAYIQEKIGMPGVFKTTAWFDNTLPHYQDAYGKRFGLALFARSIVAHGHDSYTGNEAILAMSFEEYCLQEYSQKVHSFLWADVQDREGDVYRFVTTHFPLTEQGASTPYQLEALVAMNQKLQPLDEFVLCGDFNAARGNETFTRLAEKYKDNIPKEYKTSIDQNLHRKNGIMLMVDGLFTTPLYQATQVLLVDGVSDHMAIVGEIGKI